DPWFHTNYAGAKDVGMYRSSYHVLYPSEPVQRQADNWFRIHPEIDVMPRVIDLELGQNQLWTTIAKKTKEMSNIVLARDGIRPIIYSRYRLIDQWLSSWSKEELNDHWYWLAQYSWLGYKEHAGPPMLPKRVDRGRVLMQQTSDHKLAPAGEVASKAVDWNRFEIGNEAQMHQFIAAAFGGTVPPVEPPPVDPPVETIAYSVRVTANVLNVRDKASSSSDDLGELTKDSVVPISVEKGDWLKIRGWIHKNWVTKV
ncbi:hypothetical protein KA005_34715, partial [bacterium]|nr:hypothetical protein [bacterium]